MRNILQCADKFILRYTYMYVPQLQSRNFNICQM